jgi:hypothetical protein
LIIDSVRIAAPHPEELYEAGANVRSKASTKASTKASGGDTKFGRLLRGDTKFGRLDKAAGDAERNSQSSRSKRSLLDLGSVSQAEPPKIYVQLPPVINCSCESKLETIADLPIDLQPNPPPPPEIIPVAADQITNVGESERSSEMRL